MGTPSKAKSTKHLKLMRGDGAAQPPATPATTTESFVPIAECNNVKGPDEKIALLDVTNFDSDGMEYISGLSDGQEVTFDANWIGSDQQQQGLRTDLRAGTLRNFKFQANDNATDPTYVIFSALVTAVPGLSGGTNQVLKGSWTLKPSGLPFWHYTSGL